MSLESENDFQHYFNATGRLTAENARLREGLYAAIRAAELALFVIRKQGVMPNHSWESGFNADLETAKAALPPSPSEIK